MDKVRDGNRGRQRCSPANRADIHIRIGTRLKEMITTATFRVCKFDHEEGGQEKKSVYRRSLHRDVLMISPSQKRVYSEQFRAIPIEGRKFLSIRYTII